MGERAFKGGDAASALIEKGGILDGNFSYYLAGFIVYALVGIAAIYTIFLLSLAIADDMGAVLVIAVAYTDHLDLVMLALAAGGFGVVVLMNRLGVRSVGLYTLVGAGIWLAVYRAGIHPTVAGVLLGLLTPARPWLNRETLRLALTEVTGQLDDASDIVELRPADVAALSCSTNT